MELSFGSLLAFTTSRRYGLVIRVLVLCVVLLPLRGNAVVDIYAFDTDSQRERYHQLVEELRCPKCQNQNLAGSDSQIAQDLRRELHRLLLEGRTDKEIKSFMVDRYGDFVLYKPRFQSSTAVLWSLPVILLFGGFIVIMLVVRRRGRQDVERDCLSHHEKSTLDELLVAESSDVTQVSNGSTQGDKS